MRVLGRGMKPAEAARRLDVEHNHVLRRQRVSELLHKGNIVDPR